MSFWEIKSLKDNLDMWLVNKSALYSLLRLVSMSSHLPPLTTLSLSIKLLSISLKLQISRPPTLNNIHKEGYREREREKIKAARLSFSFSRHSLQIGRLENKKWGLCFHYQPCDSDKSFSFKAHSVQSNPIQIRFFFTQYNI